MFIKALLFFYNISILKVIKTSKIPIICICNDRQSQKIRSLANHCYDLRVKRPTKQQIANAQKKQIILMDWDKYGGRVLGDVILDGKSLRGMLIQQGFAREYYGEAKTSWCN